MIRRFCSTSFVTNIVPKVLNTKTGNIEPILSINNVNNVSSKSITWYTCGPTVYDVAHLGHARTYVAFDIIQRILKQQFGIQVFHLMGITDVDDKLLKRAAENRNMKKTEETTVASLARKYEGSFMGDMAKLDVSAPFAYTRVSEYISEIIDFVQQLEKKGMAYAASDGSVYFDVSAYSRYGVFKKIFPESSIEGGDEDTAVKKNPKDFALWKKTKEGEDECRWASPWGEGRPGWHIECSSFCRQVFGETLDIHAGGCDLAFPHHENEVAQCQALFDNDWPRMFLHAGHLYIHGAKMSKSLKNFTSVESFLKNNTARQFRLFCLLHKYNANVEFSSDRMSDAKSWEDRLNHFLGFTAKLSPQRSNMKTLKWSPASQDYFNRHQESLGQIQDALANDIDTPAAMSLLKKLMATTEAGVEEHGIPWPVAHTCAANIISIFHNFGLVMDANNNNSNDAAAAAVSDGAVVDALLRYRSEVRALALAEGSQSTLGKSIMQLCDQVRDKSLPALGLTLKDGKNASYTLVKK